MKLVPSLAIAFLAGLLVPGHAAPVTFVADPAHSSIRFSVRNVLLRVTGKFADFKATLQVDEAHPEQNVVKADIVVASIDTRERKRDAHLQQPEFFDAARHPLISFQGTHWEKVAPANFEIAGKLSIRGVTKPVVLQAHLIESEAGQQRWEAKTTLNRHDFGVSGYNGIIGADVDVSIALVVRRKS